MGMQVVASKDAEIEELKKRLKEATDIIKSRDDTISARDTQIAGLQGEVYDIRAANVRTKVCAFGEGVERG
jgi:hypothetical protein